MWLKWLGSGIILSASVIGGNRKAKCLQKREQQLNTFIQLCQRMETEISYGQTPLPQIFMMQGKQLKPPIGGICTQTGLALSHRKGETLTHIWSQVLEKYREQLYLTAEDMEIVIGIGNELGLSYCGEQVKKLQILALRLQEQEKCAQEERGKMEKVWQVLGWCVGGILVLLFV